MEGGVMTESHRTAAFFDLDKTIIATSSTTAFSRELRTGGLLTPTDALRTAYAQFLFMLGGADARQTSRMRDAIAETITGWEVAKVTNIVEETVNKHIDPMVFDEALSLIHRHQANGRDVVIVSASGTEVVGPIAKLLGTKDFIATQMEVKDGKYTGKLSLYCYGPQKAEAIKALAKKRGYDLARCYAYSDSITDTPMLDAVGYGYVVNPDRTLRRAAAEHGWGVLRFVKPVALKASNRRRNVIAAGAVAALLVLVWIGVSRQVRRRHRDAF
jgi:HAD superfamily hydrolase (TIGR01490 family)